MQEIVKQDLDNEEEPTYEIGEWVTIRARISAVKHNPGEDYYFIEIPGYNDQFVAFTSDIVGRI